MQKPARPRIGVTGPDTGGGAAWFFTALAVWLCGGVPVRIRPGKPKPITDLNALIIGGGADIDPESLEEKHYLEDFINQPREHKKVNLGRKALRLLQGLLLSIIYYIRKHFSAEWKWSKDQERDKLEFALLHGAVENNLPVLGICRGAQLINIFFVGNLHEEIAPYYIEDINRNSIFPVKKVELKPGSKLSRIFKVDHLWVNALHHQAVNNPGKNIDIVGWEPNKIVQAIESTGHNFIIGVQWHPEYLLNRHIHRKIFIALVKAARGENFEN